VDNKCPVCNLAVPKPQYFKSKEKGMNNYSCDRCGNYDIERAIEWQLSDMLRKDNKKMAALSHWIRTKHESIVKEPPNDRGNGKSITLDQELVDGIVRIAPPNPAEQADNFVRWIGDNIEYGRHYVPAKKHFIEAIIGSVNEQEFNFVSDHLKKEGIIETETAVGKGNTDHFDVTLSFSGWEYYRELKRGDVDSRKAFMAMQYDDEKLDSLVDDVFTPAVGKTGFKLFKLEDRPKAGLIDDRLRVEIQTSRFLIADLTHENRGAYWEAGYAEGLGKPVIYTCERTKFRRLKTHFDTNHHLTILWDADNPSEAAEELKATIRATLPGEAKLIDG
jgi:hypothetical protein